MNARLKYIFMFIAIALTCACNDGDDHSYTISGIGTLERNDTALVIHYYDYQLIIDDNDLTSELEDSARIQFKCQTVQHIESEETIYTATLLSVSSDLTTPLLISPADSLLSIEYNSTAWCTPSDMHITRDWTERDFFNITAYYNTIDGNEDYLYLTYDSTEQQNDTTTDRIILWLKHFQLSSDSCPTKATTTISVPLKQLKNDSLERVYLRVRRYTMYGDTTEADYTYGYK